MDSTTYPKIETLFERNPDFTVDTTRLRRPEYGLIREWVLTEKVDGTNIRLIFSRDDWMVRGKTDNASMHPKLQERLEDICDEAHYEVSAIMAEYDLTEFVLYGEGYGEKVNSGGRYRSTSKDQAFVLFDVRSDGAWLDENQISATADRLKIDRVPIVSPDLLTIGDAVSLVTTGFASDVAEEPDPTFMAEGVVAKTIVPLYDRRGERVMWKLKARDFRAGKR